MELRSLVKDALHAGWGTGTPKMAANGQLALQMLTHGSVDVLITQDILPDMAENELVEQVINRGFNAHIVVLATNPMAAAKTAKNFLKLGRVHFLETPSEPGLKRFTSEIRNILEKISKSSPQKVAQAEKVLTTSNHEKVAPQRIDQQPGSEPERAHGGRFPKVAIETLRPKVICIGSSTGGPAALELVVGKLAGKSRVPILVVQHMPAGFTESLAARLQVVSGVPAAEAKPGEELKPGRIYIAPGDFHMRLVEDAGGIMIALDRGPKRNSVRPCVDILFETAAAIFGRATLGMILTGMGEDGAMGSLAVKKAGGAIVIQDQDSSVVWGMPGAVYHAGWFDAMGNLEKCAEILGSMSHKT
ncbi:MAG: hypothetical protein RIQ81_1293 [Pseudomonadota bacterium]